MKQGRRIANPALKQLAGTFRNDRHGDIVALADVTPSHPAPPAYLSVLARAIWDEEMPRVLGSGASVADTSIIARYCEMEALFRASIAMSELPKTALLTELRRTAELLGIGGQRSRLARANNDAPKASPFTLAPK